MRTNLIKTVTAGVIAAGLLGGCATQANKDPLEGLNRGIYKFNDTIDKAAVKPVAGAYKAVVPSPLRLGVSNFFSNLGDVVTVVNDLLQFRFSKAMDDAGRVAINTTFGIAGIFDWASKDGIEKRNEDFGQTLAYWGWQDSAYLVLPFLGPSTLRDTGGLIVDGALFDPVYYVDDPAARNQLLIASFIDKRSQYLPGSDLLDEAALDPYVFMRDAYLQRRSNMTHDGEERERVKEESDAEDAVPADKVASAVAN
ncbi:MAG TPA: VacJ family lipoprotein [Novimethylophilus sp.]|jgi:phospholipid-binding lipoprotein MlaA|uniref:MlaA family lipoprotein n=1 Tax=Novimethylophilus sp. TaxID=2137426 RepID=UPI002F41470D